MVRLCLLQAWAQARALAAGMFRGTTSCVFLPPPPKTGGRPQYCKYLPSSTYVQNAGSVSFVMAGGMVGTRVKFWSLQSDPRVQLRSLFTALVSHTLVLVMEVEAGVYQTHAGLF